MLSSEPLDSELWDRRSFLLAGNADNTSVLSSSGSCSPSSSGSSATSSYENEEPPDYVETVQRPTIPVKYKFSTISFNTTLVVSSSDEDSASKYHISIAMDCFIPSSYITTVRSGCTDYGAFVAQFELGGSKEFETVNIHGSECLISSRLSKLQGSSKGQWLWRTKSKTKGLTWDCRAVPFVCRSIYYSELDVLFKKQVKLATFTPRTGGPIPRRSSKVAELVVEAAGQKYFDDILVSLLILERKRLAPKVSSVRDRIFG